MTYLQFRFAIALFLFGAFSGVFFFRGGCDIHLEFCLNLLHTCSLNDAIVNEKSCSILLLGVRLETSFDSDTMFFRNLDNWWNELNWTQSIQLSIKLNSSADLLIGSPKQRIVANFLQFSCRYVRHTLRGNLGPLTVLAINSCSFRGTILNSNWSFMHRKHWIDGLWNSYFSQYILIFSMNLIRFTCECGPGRERDSIYGIFGVSRYFNTVCGSSCFHLFCINWNEWYMTSVINNTVLYKQRNHATEIRKPFFVFEDLRTASHVFVQPRQSPDTEPVRRSIPSCFAYRQNVRSQIARKRYISIY